MSDSELLRSDVIGLLDSDPVPDPSDGLRTRARGLARQVAEKASAALPEGTLVGPYAVRGVLGRGGQAVVYRGEDAQGRMVALKVPRAELLQRLIREAQILFLLDHPRVVRIERADVKADVPYLACELCPGGTLADRLKQRTLEPAEALALADQVLEALAHGHAKGVVHRDIKPSNVLFDAEGRVKVADFGIGSLALVEGTGGLPGTLVSLDRSVGAGTPVYMAPEQEHAALRVNGKVDGRADLYALGKVLYEALTGRTPRTVRPVSSLLPGIDPAWDAFIFKLLEDRPEQRPGSADEAREMVALLRNPGTPPAVLAPAASPSPAPTPSSTPTKDVPRGLMLLLLTLALGGVPVAWAALALLGGGPWLGVGVGVVVLELVVGAACLVVAERPRRREAAAAPAPTLPMVLTQCVGLAVALAAAMAMSAPWLGPLVVLGAFVVGFGLAGLGAASGSRRMMGLGAAYAAGAGGAWFLAYEKIHAFNTVYSVLHWNSPLTWAPLALVSLAALAAPAWIRLAAARSAVEPSRSPAPPPPKGWPDAIGEVVRACDRMSRSRQGALIAFERRDSLQKWIAQGTPLDASVGEHLLVTTFWPNTPLHEGALIIRAGRIAAAGCFLRIAVDQVPGDARQLAATALSRQTDAVVVAVSEDVSLAVGGQLIRGLPGEALERQLRALLAAPEWPPREPAPEPRPDPLAVPVSELGLSMRALQALEAAGISDVVQLTQMRAEELLGIRYFGRVTLKEIERKLEERGLRLSTDEPAADVDALRLKPRREAPRRRDTPQPHKAQLVFYDADIERINQALEELQNLTKSRCNLLVDVQGHPVTMVGSCEGVNLETLAALVAASFAATKEVAKIAVNEPEFFRIEQEGKSGTVHLRRIEEEAILVTMFDRSMADPDRVRYEASQIRPHLHRILEEIRGRKKR